MATKYLFSAMKARTGSPVQKLILIFLADSANESGVCWPAHSTIAANCECSVASVKRHISELSNRGYIRIENKANKGFKTSNRYYIADPECISSSGIPTIAQSEPSSTIAQSELTDSSQRAIEPISNLPTNNSLSKGRFVKPTIDEVMTYTLSRPVQIDPETFVDFYESKGWMVGKTKMKDWKAAVRTWEKRERPARGVAGKSRETTLTQDLTDTSWAR